MDPAIGHIQSSAERQQRTILPLLSMGVWQPPRCREWIFLDAPSDIIIDIEGTQFALHKVPLISRSGRIRKFLAENNKSLARLDLVNLPGGAEAFELATKFCYGVNFEITSANVAQLYCISDYLEMTEEYGNDNLASRSESYLGTVVCKSLELAVHVLQKCEKLLPLADELKIVSRCIDAIAAKACAEQIASSFSRLEYSSSGRLQTNKQAKGGGDWWIDDLSILRIDLYQRVIEAIKCRGVRPESIGASLVSFSDNFLARKSSIWTANCLPRGDMIQIPTDDIKLVVETISSLMPVEKVAVPISFLFRLLRTAVVLDCTMSCRLTLEKKIGCQLELATLDDLLIPSFRHSADTLFDVDTIHRILINFSQQDDSGDELEDRSGFESDGHSPPSQTAMVKVANLVDEYLAEIASDSNLRLANFLVISQTLPAYARTKDDSLYRAVDIFLKAHPGLSELEKKKLCKLIDFQKLSEAAATHAAQNERLPLQAIVQVLYLEQLRLRDALCGSCPDDDDQKNNYYQSQRISGEALSAAMSPRDNYASLRRENRELKLELARMRMRLNDLEKGHACMKQDLSKSNSKKFVCSVYTKLGKLNFFSNSSSRGPASPSKNSSRSGFRSSRGSLR